MVRLSIITAILLVGCSNKPTRVAWLSVEKPPIKVIYIDKQGHLDPVITARVFNAVNNTDYEDTLINNSTSVLISAESSQSDVESNTNSLSITRSP